jgi:hypothetical protein
LEIEGPFSLAKSGLPVVEMRSTRIVGEQRIEATVTSTGEQAFVTTGGATRELTGEEAQFLRVRGGSLGALDIDLGAWIEDAKIEDGPGATERITGELDMAAALDGMARAAGSELPGDARRRLVDSLRDSSVEIVTGKEDRLLRSVRLRATIEIPAGLEGLLDLSGTTKLEFDADLSKINRPVRVEAPAAG